MSWWLLAPLFLTPPGDKSTPSVHTLKAPHSTPIYDGTIVYKDIKLCIVQGNSNHQPRPMFDHRHAIHPVEFSNTAIFEHVCIMIHLLVTAYLKCLVCYFPGLPSRQHF